MRRKVTVARVGRLISNVWEKHVAQTTQSILRESSCAAWTDDGGASSQSDQLTLPLGDVLIVPLNGLGFVEPALHIRG